jgi:hypothetical protein
VVAFFTGGTMKMGWRRFLLLDGLGIALIVPVLTWLGCHSANFIDRMIATVQKVERGILWGALGAAALVGLWYWLWRRRQRRNRRSGLTETFVQPRRIEPPVGADPTTTDPVAPMAPDPGEPEAKPPAPPAGA